MIFVILKIHFIIEQLLFPQSSLLLYSIHTIRKQVINTSDIFNIARIHEMQYKLDSSAGNYLKARNEYRSSDILDDSICNLGKAKQFSEV